MKFLNEPPARLLVIISAPPGGQRTNSEQTHGS
jgi:hypothetical protein